MSSIVTSKFMYRGKYTAYNKLFLNFKVNFDNEPYHTWERQITGLHCVYRAVDNVIPGVPTFH
jgi:hypothetical protein